jgi:hypothetical protein
MVEYVAGIKEHQLRVSCRRSSQLTLLLGFGPRASSSLPGEFKMPSIVLVADVLAEVRLTSHTLQICKHTASLCQ